MSQIAVNYILNLNVQLQAASLSRLAFGIPLVYDTENVLGAGAAGLVNTYSGNILEDMAADGYKPWHAAYKMVEFMLQSQLHPSVVRVASSTAATLTDQLDAIVGLNAQWYFLLLTSRDAQDVEDAAAWALDQNGEKYFLGGVTFNDAGRTVAAAVLAADSVTTSVFYVGTQAQVRTITINKDYVSGAAPSLSVNGQTASAAWGSSGSNAQVLGDLADDIATKAGVLSAVSDGSHKITVTMADPLIDLVISGYADANSNPTTARFATVTAADTPTDAALCGQVAPKTPGSTTAALKRLPGCTALPMSTGDAQDAEALNINFYANIGGRDLTFGGWASAMLADGVPLFADLVWGKAGFQADLTAALLDALTSQDKLPFNDAGIGAVVGILGNIANRWVGKGFLEPFNAKTAITFPRAADIDPAEKSLRVLNGIKGQFVATGAIHKIGLLTVTIQA